MLAGSVAMSMTGRHTPQEAFEDIYTINDGPAVSSREAILELFDKALARGLRRSQTARAQA